MDRVIRTFACVAATAALAFSQAGDTKSIPLSKVERKNKAPVSTEVLRVKLPRPVEFDLANGLTVLVLEDHRRPTVNVQLRIRGAGALYDPVDAPGLASFTAQMLSEGTKTRTSRQIAEQSESLGANIRSAAPFGSEYATVDVSGLSDNIAQWMAIATDVLLNPTFPEKQLQSLKTRQKAMLRQSRSNSNFLLSERFNRAVYGSHPAGTIMPTTASIDAITPQVLEAFYHERYVPQNAIVAIAGDVHLEQVRAMLDNSPAWDRGNYKLSPLAATKALSAKKIFLVDRPGSVQTDIDIGNIAVDRRSNDYYAVEVMNRIVGGGPAARLFMNLREEKGYTYGVYSRFVALDFAGPWLAFGNMRTDVTEGAIVEFMKELRRISEEKVPDAELNDAKRGVIAAFAMSLEHPAELLNYAVQAKEYNFSSDYWDQYPGHIAAVTSDDVQGVARKYLNLDAIQIAAVGDASKIRSILEKFGPVEVYDIEGNLLH